MWVNLKTWLKKEASHKRPDTAQNRQNLETGIRLVEGEKTGGLLSMGFFGVIKMLKIMKDKGICFLITYNHRIVYLKTNFYVM